MKFTFQIETSAHVKKLRFTRNDQRGKSIHIEKFGIKIELYTIFRLDYNKLAPLFRQEDEIRQQKF